MGRRPDLTGHRDDNLAGDQRQQVCTACTTRPRRTFPKVAHPMRHDRTPHSTCDNPTGRATAHAGVRQVGPWA